MKKLWFFVVLIFTVVVGCENEVVDDGGGKGSSLQEGEEEKYSLVGDWQLIFKKEINSGKLTSANNQTILKISTIDTMILEEQDLAVVYEVFVDDVLFHKGFSPIFKLSSTPTENAQIWTRKCWIYLPYVEMRSCNIQFVSPNNQPSLDTLCFTGSLDKVYYARMK